MGAMAAVATPPVEEVRVAMALNGGVSLAVWMGGCAVELDAARRAHAATEAIGNGDDAIERRVYNDLLTAFRRRFVVDIMTGASAGGINGALLAAAARHERRLHPDFLRRKWLHLGDFAKLLHSTRAENAQSLMQGQRFHELAVETFTELLTPANAETASLTDVPSNQAGVGPTDALLDVTVTNVAGEPGGVLDKWGEELFAREHRARFRFREADHFNAQALAAAARATASFPGAFEPFRVEGAAATIAGFDGPRYAVDGGLLDNAPIRAAIELIPKRGTDPERLVKRFVCYLNADPPRRAPADEDGVQQPTIPDVVGYVINLPRNAPFYDQLLAVEDAVRRREVARDGGAGLLMMDVDAVVTTADALLPAYRRRRALESLDQIALDAGTARRAMNELGDPGALPWIPDDLAVPTSPDAWDWGIAAGERIVHLLLDVIRTAVDAADGIADPALLAARADLYEQLRLLTDVRETFSAAVPAARAELQRGGSVAAALAKLADRAAEARRRVYACVTAATNIVLGVSELLDPALAASLFGAARSPDHDFIRRALAIEVVRRTFAPPDEVEPAQVPDFVQLTPVVPIRILSSGPLRRWAREFGEVRADSPNTKLTGIILGHFGGFYRYSWRANDFMWGRLDAATRIVDMLVDPARAAAVGAEECARSLASALVPEGDDRLATERRWLVHEALHDAVRDPPPVGETTRAALDGYPVGEETPDRDTLEEWLRAALVADLADADGGCLLTRVVAARAVQLEILRHELPILFHQAQEDVKRGCFTRALSFGVDGQMQATIKNMRGCPTLPELLGRDRADESVSNLALSTVARAMFVALSVLRSAKIPLGRTLAVTRAVALPVAGIASPRWPYRAATFLGFVAATAYVIARFVSADSAPIGLKQALSKPTLVQVLALAVVLAVVAVPALRSWRAEIDPSPPTAPPPPPDAPPRSQVYWIRRVTQAGWAAAMLVLVLVVPWALMVGPGPLDNADIVFAPHAAAPPWWVVWPALIAILADAALRLVRFAPLRGRAKELLASIVREAPTLLLVAVAATTTLVWSIDVLRDQDDWEWWRLCSAGSAGIGAILAGIYLSRRRR